VIGCAVPCGPRSIKYGEEENIMDVDYDERTIMIDKCTEAWFMKEWKNPCVSRRSYYYLSNFLTMN